MLLKLNFLTHSAKHITDKYVREGIYNPFKSNQCVTVHERPLQGSCCLWKNTVDFPTSLQWKKGKLGRTDQEITSSVWFLAVLWFGPEEITSQHTIENYAFVADAFLFFPLPWICLRNCKIKMQNNNYI